VQFQQSRQRYNADDDDDDDVDVAATERVVASVTR